jgi:dephospho-CoA kinase
MAKVIGLTGPIGAGKDEAAKILHRSGALIIDADEVAHTLYDTQTPIWQVMVREFGSRVLNRGGKINRKRLGEIVFSDTKQLMKLDRIIHPYLKEAIIKLAEKGKAESRKLIVINAAVLKEIGLLNYVDKVWVVMASREARLKRLLKTGLDKKQVKVRMQSQMSQKEYLELADVVIQNEGTLKELSKEVSGQI